MKKVIIFLLLTTLIYSRTYFTFNLYEVNVTEKTIHYSLNGTKFLMTLLYPSELKEDFVGIARNEIVPILMCFNATNRAFLHVTARVDVQFGTDKDFPLYPNTLLSPGNTTVCTLTVMSTANLSEESITKLLAAGKLAAIMVTSDIVSLGISSWFGIATNLLKIFQKARGLFFNLKVITPNATLNIERYLYYKILDHHSKCLKIRALTPLPLTPGSKNILKLTNVCNYTLEIQFYKDLAYDTDVMIFEVWLKPHQTRKIEFALDDVNHLRSIYIKECPYQQYLETGKCKDVVASIPYFDILRFLKDSVTVVWYGPNGEPVDSIYTEGVYRACIKLPELLPKLQFKGDVKIILVHDRIAMPDQHLVNLVHVNSLEDLDGKCIEFYAEKGFFTRGYRLELEAFGEKVKLGYELKKG